MPRMSPQGWLGTSRAASSPRRNAASQIRSRHRSTASRVRPSRSSASRSMAPTYDRIRSMLSRMSARQTAGSWLEDTPPIPIHVGTNTRLFDWLGQQIDGAAEDLRQASFDSRQSDHPDPGSWIQLHDKIDIAGRAGLAARQRAEQADMADASLLATPPHGRVASRSPARPSVLWRRPWQQSVAQNRSCRSSAAGPEAPKGIGAGSTRSGSMIVARVLRLARRARS